MSSQIIPLKGRTDFQGSSRILATETIRVLSCDVWDTQLGPSARGRTLALAGIAAIFCRCRDDPAVAEDELVVAWQLLRAKTKREPFSGVERWPSTPVTLRQCASNRGQPAPAHGVSPNESIGGPLAISIPGTEAAVIQHFQEHALWAVCAGRSVSRCRRSGTRTNIDFRTYKACTHKNRDW